MIALEEKNNINIAGMRILITIILRLNSSGFHNNEINLHDVPKFLCII